MACDTSSVALEASKVLVSVFPSVVANDCSSKDVTVVFPSRYLINYASKSWKCEIEV